MSGAVERERTLASRYAIQQEIGRGGMGVVYLAYDLRLQHPVAVKFLNRELAGALGGERFIDEIRTNARLRHPHILPVTDSGEIDGELFFVTPFIDGPSLRERLDRGPRFSVAEALRIAREIASALAHVHAHGAVHRDIKPDNVILDAEGNALIADFGLAFVLSRVDSSRLTLAGLTVGSPAYMSPEQAVGETQIDGRSDIYALGCVLFELLTGEPPFNGGGAQATMRRHIVEPPPSVRRRRADIPASVDRLLEQALAKDPDDRFPTAQTLAQALDVELARLVAPEPYARPRKTRIDKHRSRLLLRLTAPLLLLAILLWATGSEVARLLGFGPAPPDSTRWLVLPLQWEAGSAAGAGAAEDLLFRDAFARWNGLTLVDRISVEEVSQSDSRQALSAGFGFDVARDHSAGRYVIGVATDLGDSLHVDVSVLDAMNGSPAVIHRVTSRLSRAELADGFALIADSLLFGRVTWDDGPEHDIGTRSYAARLHYSDAHRALARWDLAQADSLLSAALDADMGFARAHLWLAQIRSWGGQPIPEWAGSAQRAATDTSHLTRRETRLAEALRRIASRDFPAGCAAYDALRSSSENDFAAWFGLGECRRLDGLVIRDRATPSGWRFRASYHAAIEAYRRAFMIEPRALMLFRDPGFERARALFFTSRRVLSGRNESGALFHAHPATAADTFVLIPHRWREGTTGPEPPLPVIERALQQQRRAFKEVARSWRAADPQNGDAAFALAIAMEMLADPAALDTIQLARRLVRDEGRGFELAVREVWMRVRFGAPAAPALARARALADSLLGTPAAPENQPALAALAVLTGRPSQAARHARAGISAAASEPSPAILRPAHALAAFASVGGPRDSIAALEAEVESAIRHSVDPTEWRRYREMYLLREAFLSFPAHSFGILRDPDLAAPTAVAYSRWLHGDTAGARFVLEQQLRARRDAVAPITLDVVFPEALLWNELGERIIARELLTRTLDDLEWSQPGTLESMHQAGALVRAMATNARLASADGDMTQARLWRDAARALWGNGEPAALAQLE